jgi:dTDP-4-dehydrorhamnose 3,5-epimerase
MKFEALPLFGTYKIDLEKITDDRGFFARLFCKREFEENNLNTQWVQINNSYNLQSGTVRGLHFQHPPDSEIKLVRCISGAIWDVIVDLRRDSPTFLQWFGLELTATNKSMLYIPEGFAHGFQTLTDQTEVLYFHNKVFKKNKEDGINVLDNQLKIYWPLPIANISERDKAFSYINKSFKGIIV